jgi:carboxyl-terminal processing protease
MARSRLLPVGALTIAVSALVGGVMGRNVAASEDRLSEDERTFTAALNVIETRYVDKVESDRIVYGAIQGMLQTLDPHSNFMDPKQYAQLRERQEGRYYGLGITISAVDGDITVVSLFEDSPAYKQGIRRGDVIAKVRDEHHNEPEDAKGWTTEDAVRRLRGPKGTPVDVYLKRPGLDGLFKVTVTRDEITIPSIPASFMLDAQTGYVRLQDFAENTDRDLGKALNELHEKGMKRLLLDIRGNPGGPLDQAIRVANRFLKKGDLIVFTRGRVPNSAADYRATEESEYDSLPMIVLANRNSASASEIVTGALQDHDRALIVGETTFGKALVQSIYRVSQGAGLALTTAHYFTPSGRLIQRPWDQTFDEYLSYTLRDQDDNRPHDAKDLKYTDSGRRVYSGGGIEPDRRLDGPIEGFNPSKFGRMLYGRQLFANFAQKFSVVGDTRPGATGKDRRFVNADFVVDQAMLDDFKKFVTSTGVKIDPAGWDADLVFIKAMIRYDIDLALFGVSSARRHLLDLDPQAQFALSLFKEAEQLTQLARSKSARVNQ